MLSSRCSEGRSPLKSEKTMVRIAYVAQHRRGLRELLEQLAETGYMVYRIDPTVLAYKKLRDNPPDIIIADATLREGHVKEVVESVSSSRITGDIPLCVVGCRMEVLDRMRKAAPGAKVVLAGEVTRKMLVEIVKQLATVLQR